MKRVMMLIAVAASVAVVYAREAPTEVSIPCWRNEQIRAQYAVQYPANALPPKVILSDFAGEHGARIPASAAVAQFQPLKDGCRPLLVTLAIPKAIPPDDYRGTITITSPAGERQVFTLVAEVRYDTLKDPDAWTFPPATWQRPWAEVKAEALAKYARVTGFEDLLDYVACHWNKADQCDALEDFEKLRLLQESGRATWRLAAAYKKWRTATQDTTNPLARVQSVYELKDAIDYMCCPGYLNGRRVECVTKAYGADLGYKYPVEEMHIVQHPLPAADRPGRPLYVVLHSSGHNAVNALLCTRQRDNHDIYRAPDDFYALYLDCKTAPGDWWYGINGTPGFEISPCEKRMLRTIEETVCQYGIDRDRIYLCGNSMGGSGCLGFGVRHGNIFAAVKGNVPALTQHACDRMGWDWHKDTDIAGVPWRELPDPPLILDHTAPNDMRWSEGREHFYRMMESRAYPFQAYWADHKHCNKNSIITAANDLYLAFDWTSVRKSDLLPAFSHASCDTPCPWPDHRDAKGAGQMNAFFRWGKGTVTPQTLAIDLFIGNLNSRTFTIPATAVADVTLRRTGVFKVVPGETLKWTFASASGIVVIGDNARITIPKLALTHTPTRLEIRR